MASSRDPFTPGKDTKATSSTPSPHVARPTAAVLNGQWQGKEKDPENKWNVTLASSIAASLPPVSSFSSSSKRYQNVQSKLYSPTAASIHNRVSPRSKRNTDDDNASVCSRFTTSSMSPKALSPVQDTSKWSKSVLHTVDPTSYQYRGGRTPQNASDSFFSSGSPDDDNASVVSRLTTASRKYADVPSRLHQPTTASIHSRAVRTSTGRSDSQRPTSSPTINPSPLIGTQDITSRPASSPVGKNSQTSRLSGSGRAVVSSIQSQQLKSTTSPKATSSATPSQATKQGDHVSGILKQVHVDVSKVEDELSGLHMTASATASVPSGARMSKPPVPSFVSVDVPAQSAKSAVSDLGSFTIAESHARVSESTAPLLDLEDETF